MTLAAEGLVLHRGGLGRERSTPTRATAPRRRADARPAAGPAPRLGLSTFGWPLVIGGTLKTIYDRLLLGIFVGVRPTEEIE